MHILQSSNQTNQINHQSANNWIDFLNFLDKNYFVSLLLLAFPNFNCVLCTVYYRLSLKLLHNILNVRNRDVYSLIIILLLMWYIHSIDKIPKNSTQAWKLLMQKNISTVFAQFQIETKTDFLSPDFICIIFHCCHSISMLFANRCRN